MIKKPEQVYGNNGRQLYYQWEQGEHHICLEPVYGHTSEYIESLESDNAKLRKLACEMLGELDAATQYDAGGSRGIVSEFKQQARELGIEVDE